MDWEKARGRDMALEALELAASDVRRRRGQLFPQVGAGAMWTAVLDEELRADIGGDYEALRDAEAPLIHGLIHARNGVMHAALITTYEGGLKAPFTFPLVVGPPSWRPASVLHKFWSPQRAGSDLVRHRIAMYERHLEGRDPADSFEEAASFFRVLRDAGWQPASFRRR